MVVILFFGTVTFLSKDSSVEDKLVLAFASFLIPLLGATIVLVDNFADDSLSLVLELSVELLSGFGSFPPSCFKAFKALSSSDEDSLVLESSELEESFAIFCELTGIFVFFISHCFILFLQFFLHEV